MANIKDRLTIDEHDNLIKLWQALQLSDKDCYAIAQAHLVESPKQNFFSTMESYIGDRVQINQQLIDRCVSALEKVLIDVIKAFNKGKEAFKAGKLDAVDLPYTLSAEWNDFFNLTCKILLEPSHPDNHVSALFYLTLWYLVERHYFPSIPYLLTAALGLGEAIGRVEDNNFSDSLAEINCINQSIMRLNAWEDLAKCVAFIPGQEIIIDRFKQYEKRCY